MSEKNGLGFIDIALAVALGILVASDDGAFDQSTAAEPTATAQQPVVLPKPPAP